MRNRQPCRDGTRRGRCPHRPSFAAGEQSPAVSPVGTSIARPVRRRRTIAHMAIHGTRSVVGICLRQIAFVPNAGRSMIAPTAWYGGDSAGRRGRRPLQAKTPRICHCEGRNGPWQSASPVPISKVFKWQFENTIILHFALCILHFRVRSPGKFTIIFLHPVK